MMKVLFVWLEMFSSNQLSIFFFFVGLLLIAYDLISYLAVHEHLEQSFHPKKKNTHLSLLKRNT
jgi:hypothetical protein